MEQWIEDHIQQGRRVIKKLLKAKRISFGDLTPSKLPDKPGIYVITNKDTGEVLRAGRTDKQTLRTRLYNNHLMGNQAGNIRAQLVREGICEDMKKAKQSNG